MRFYPIPDVDFYIETPPLWSYYCCQPDRNWKQVKYEQPHYISYWRELDIIKKDKEKKKMADAKKEREEEVEKERKKKLKERKKEQMKEKAGVYYRSPPKEDKRKKEEKKPEQMDEEYDNWPKSRIRLEACLPIYNSTGHRLRLQRADPVGFKGAPMPISLAEARENKARIKAARVQRRAAAKAERARKRKERRDADENAWRKFNALSIYVWYNNRIHKNFDRAGKSDIYKGLHQQQHNMSAY
uniref:Uncharacterized protein n=1 Tax=Glossina morsitans morsitans TaxID=37546 RepID=A0A1B0G4H1_GLOMM